MESGPRTTDRRSHPTGWVRAVAVLACLLVSGIVPQSLASGGLGAVPVEAPGPGGEEGGSDPEPASPVPARAANPARPGRPAAGRAERAPSAPHRPAELCVSQRPQSVPAGNPSRPPVLRC